jgi:glycosyltransferase involved in cell wall biosynthesis
LTRGDVAVCVVGAGSDEKLRVPTPAGVPIVEVESQAEALASTAPADVVLLRPGCRVAPGWLDALREAAYASSTTATATALTQHDLAGDVGPDALAGDVAPDALEPAAAAVRAASLRLRPRVAAPGHACVYVRRSAIELVGTGGEDVWTKCLVRGLSHVLADDVLVFDTAAPTRGIRPPSPPAKRAVNAARRAHRGLTLTIDARILSGPTTGTHVHVLELIAALARSGQRLTALVPEQPSEHARARLCAVPGVALTTYRATVTHRADVVHRPFQLTNAGDLNFLESLGERLVLTQQDLIAFHNPAYFPSTATWHDYRQLTRSALNAADRVLFFSGHARDDALAEELVDPGRASVVYLGVEHAEALGAPAPPAGAERIGAHPFLLYLGTDFLHKNRVFALRLLAALHERGADAKLVFAGPSVAHGSSRAEERAFTVAHPGLAEHVFDLGAVSEPEKNWLYENAALVLYPSVIEGFGLVPFEAAAHRVPCLWASGSALRELLPDEQAEIVPWDEVASAQNAMALLEDDAAREQNLKAVHAAARTLTWDATAAGLLEVYRATADAPAKPRAGVGITLSEDAARLVGPGGELPPEVHRPLLALATHPKLARPVWSALRLGYGLLHRRR